MFKSFYTLFKTVFYFIINHQRLQSSSVSSRVGFRFSEALGSFEK